MPVLAAITWYPAPTFRITRSYLWGFAIGWHANSGVIGYGNPTTLFETVYGGYRVRVKFRPWVFAAGNKSFTLSDCFEDLYAMAPGSSTPINAGLVVVAYQTPALIPSQIISISFTSPDTWYLFQEMPPPSPGYWAKPVSPPIEAPFVIT